VEALEMEETAHERRIIKVNFLDKLKPLGSG
jgi:hypothetical protein